MRLRPLFWANYIGPGPQDDVVMSKSDVTDEDVAKRLKKKIVQYINENNVPEITEDDIEWYGIRDWGREPYGGANHAWRPERKYWHVMAHLAQIESVTGNYIHVCGEAYSDYHGFMEGSLRSSTYITHRILENQSNDLEWLAKVFPTLDEKYRDSLKEWITDLDRCATISSGEYHYKGEKAKRVWSPKSC